jgi:hypothetical protein
VAWQEFVGIKSVDSIAGEEAVASTAYDTTVNTAAITTPAGAARISIFIDLSAIGADANETLDIDLEWSPDEGTTWFQEEPPQTFDQILQTNGADQNIVKQFNVNAPTYRLALVLAGTSPEFTFAVDHVGMYA